jgi:hypothetical protein
MKKLLLTISLITCSSLLNAELSTPKKPCHLYSELKRETISKLRSLKRNDSFAAALALGVFTSECQNGRRTTSPEDHGPATEMLRNLGFLNKEGFIHREICECLVAEPSEECRF